jgi:transposase
MAFREVRMFEVREVLRLWLSGESLRSIERMAQVDRKTVRRYVAAAAESGLDRSLGVDQLNDSLLGQVVEKVRPQRAGGHGAARQSLGEHKEKIKDWLDKDDLTIAKVHDLLTREGVTVPLRTLERFCFELCGPRRRRGTTVRVADGEPGAELQADFGRMGLVFDSASERRRVCHALILTACLSRYCYVFLSFAQTTAVVIDGLEAAWTFFGGMFRVLVPDNMSAIVDDADPLEPRLNQAFVEYAQDRGFLVDAARVRHPTDKPKVERTVPYVRRSFFAGEHFVDLADAQRRGEHWCREKAGMRVHGTTACRPAEHFATVEAPVLLPAPMLPYDLPHYATAKVHRDHHIEVKKALYSVPGAMIGKTVEVRADRQLVKIFHRGQLVKTHPRQDPGGRSTDAEDLPPGRDIYALRDLERLRAKAALHGQAIGTYAAVILDHPLPWTKMRQVYALLGLIEKWGADLVEDACRRAADAESFSVHLIGRMLERGSPSDESPPTQGRLITGRFVRPAEDFQVRPADRGRESGGNALQPAEGATNGVSCGSLR